MRRANPHGKVKIRADGTEYIVESNGYKGIVNARLRSYPLSFKQHRERFNNNFNKAVLDTYHKFIKDRIISRDKRHKQQYIEAISQLFEELFYRLYSRFKDGYYINDAGFKVERDRDMYIFPPSPGGFQAYSYWHTMRLFLSGSRLWSHDYISEMKDNRTIRLFDDDLYELPISHFINLFYSMVTNNMNEDSVEIFNLWWSGMRYDEMPYSLRTVNRRMQDIFSHITNLTGLDIRQIRGIRRINNE